MKKIILLGLITIIVFGLFAKDESNNTTTKIPFHPADQSLFLMPTAYTMPKGMAAITDIELVLIQYSAAPTEDFHISFGMGFPIVSEMVNLFTVGVKYKYVNEKAMNVAAWVSYTPDSQVLSCGNVFSFSKDNTSFHVSPGYITSYKDDVEVLLMMGGMEVSATPRTSFIIESVSGFDLTDDDNDDDNDDETILTLGFRLKGDRISWDLGGSRLLNSMRDSDVFLIPFLKATFMF